jgi:uncharacterized SAM-binding protein YcdF (DUF218 family)
MRRIAFWTVFAGAVVGWMTLHVAEWLVVEDPLQPAVAIAVLGGKMPFRAMEAAQLYRSGYASEIWLPGPEGPAEHEPIKKLGLGLLKSDLYYKVLESMGVPRTAVRMLSAVAVKNTREEIAVICRALRNVEGGKVIIVTSPTHTRRVKHIWTASAALGHTSVIRYTRHEPQPLQLANWLTREEERRIVLHEIGGIVDIWLRSPMMMLGLRRQDSGPATMVLSVP